ncbi:deazapurine DNA modification protein DpdA family protein [Nocardia jinanensis]|uniref:deazapurine DNA modification protein DpdA family protein n=1 Tax=Nocardia jinanensis TaxID=382504 RepID=UPI00402B11AF
MAWSDAARREATPLPGCAGHKNCANCIVYAFRWRQRILASLAGHATRTPARPTPYAGRCPENWTETYVLRNGWRCPGSAPQQPGWSARPASAPPTARE